MAASWDRDPASRHAANFGNALLCAGRIRALAALVCLLTGRASAAGLADAWEGTYWGEAGSALVAHFGARATVLPRPIDFGDSYAQIVLRRVVVGQAEVIEQIMGAIFTRGHCLLVGVPGLAE